LFHPIVKEQVLPGQLAGLKTNPDTTEACPKSQAESQIYFSRDLMEVFVPANPSQAFTGGP
jgi:hypothetical protein